MLGPATVMSGSSTRFGGLLHRIGAVPAATQLHGIAGSEPATPSSSGPGGASQGLAGKAPRDALTVGCVPPWACCVAEVMYYVNTACAATGAMALPGTVHLVCPCLVRHKTVQTAGTCCIAVMITGVIFSSCVWHLVEAASAGRCLQLWHVMPSQYGMVHQWCILWLNSRQKAQQASRCARPIRDGVVGH